MSVYDNIAEKYKQTGQMAVRYMSDYSFVQRFGDLTGKAVLDLACGEGRFSRMCKQMGAARVVGVDVSTEMLRLAREQEAQEPLDIEYIHANVRELRKIDEFDLIIASHLLHYAPTQEALTSMCHAVARNLKPGHRFVTLNQNAHLDVSYLDHRYEKYGFAYRLLSGSPETGYALNLTLFPNGEQIDLTIYHLPIGMYTAAFEAAGFSSVTWHPLELPAEMEQAYGRGFWQCLLKYQCVNVIECQK